MNDDELRDLQERAHQIRELQAMPQWAMLHDYVSAMVNAKNRSLLNGNAKTIEEYRADAGWINGALFVLNAADRLDEQLKDSTNRIIEQREAA